MKVKKQNRVWLSLALLLVLLAGLWYLHTAGDIQSQHVQSVTAIYLDDIPPFSGEPYVAVNGNEPSFLPGEMTTSSYEVQPPGRAGALRRCLRLRGGGPDAYRGTGVHRPGEALRMADGEV